MDLRMMQEEREKRMLGPNAARSAETKGREHPEPQCDIRTDPADEA